jgi:hypothetical protein
VGEPTARHTSRVWVTCAACYAGYMQVVAQRLGLRYVRADRRCRASGQNPAMTTAARNVAPLDAALRGVHVSDAERASLVWLSGQEPATVRTWPECSTGHARPGRCSTGRRDPRAVSRRPRGRCAGRRRDLQHRAVIPHLVFGFETATVGRTWPR